MTIVVRRADPSDIPVLRETRLRALRDSPAAFGSTLERELSRSDDDWRGWFHPGSVFLAEDESGAVVGMVCSAPDAGREDDGGDDRVWLMAMWVAPDARGDGVGDLLAAAVVDAARSTGANTVALHLIDDNVPARRLYERCGFVDNGVRMIRERDGATEIEMCRSVTDV